MTHFFCALQLLSLKTKTFYEFDCECEAQCIVEAKAIMRTLANALIDENPSYLFVQPTFVFKPLLVVVQNERA